MSTCRVGIIVSICSLSAACISIDIEENDVLSPRQNVPSFDTINEMTIRNELSLERGVGLPFKTNVTHGLQNAGDIQIAWTFIKADVVGEDRPLILHCGGADTDRYYSAGLYAPRALPHGDILMFDYPGYGDSSGTATRENFPKLVSALANLLGDTKVQNQNLIIWGHSLGGFICPSLVQEGITPNALILETSAQNVRKVAYSKAPGILRPFIRFNIPDEFLAYDTLENLDGYAGDIFVIGVEPDDVLPVQNARNLSADLAKMGHDVNYVEYKDVSHYRPWDGEGYADDILAFFAKLRESQTIE